MAGGRRAVSLGLFLHSPGPYKEGKSDFRVKSKQRLTGMNSSRHY